MLNTSTHTMPTRTMPTRTTPSIGRCSSGPFRSLVIALMAAVALFASACSAESTTTVESADDQSDEQVDDAPAGDTDSNASNDSATDPDTTDPDTTDDPLDGSVSGVNPKVRTFVFDDAANADGGLTDDQIRCADESLEENAELFSAVMSSDDRSAFSPDQQADLFVIAAECAPGPVSEAFLAGFSSEAGADFPAEAGTCILDLVVEPSDRQRPLIIGFLALNDGIAVPANSQEPVVDTMVECIPPSAFSQAIVAQLDDPTLTEGVDQACLNDGIDGESLRGLWTALVADPNADFDNADPALLAPLMDNVFGCISFGQIFANQFAAEGTTLSEPTIGCIDDGLGELDLFAIMNDPTDDGEAMGTVMLGCLTPDELASLGG